MIIIETIIVAFSMFSAIPMPQIAWNERNMRYSLLAFPLIGAVIALVCALWVRLSEALAFPGILRGAVLFVLPLVLTGGIHLDGYADTWDALSSHSTPSRRQEILKDPHLGAFAAIRLGIYFIAGFGVWTSLPVYRPLHVAAVFCLSRALSALALTLFPLRPGSGLARSFAEAAPRARMRFLLAGLCLILSVFLILRGEWLCVAAAAAVFARYYRMCRRDFGGLSGDLAGWFLQTAELWMAFALCLWPYVEAAL